MLDTLIETRRRREWKPRVSLISLAIHAVLIALLSVATEATARTERPATVARIVYATPVAKEEPPPPAEEEPPPPDEEPEPPRAKAPAEPKATPRPPRRESPDRPPAPPRGFRVLTAPIDIPDALPDIDLGAPVITEADFSGKGVPGGTARGVGARAPARVRAASGSRIYAAVEVERAARPRADNPTPRYPPMLQRARVNGTVLVQFVVDTRGRVETRSIKVLESTDDLFSRAVRTVLPRMRFDPATSGGRPVRQLVQQPFHFVVR